MRLMTSGVMLRLFALFFPIVSKGCEICLGEDAVNFNESMPVDIPGFSFIQDCGALQEAGGILTEAQCAVIQRMGSLCGCSTQNAMSCALCGNSEATVPESFRSVVIEADQEVVGSIDSELASFLPFITPSCEMIEAYLYSVNQEESKCADFQELLETQCGCEGTVMSNNTNSNNGTDTDNDTVLSPCDVCEGGEGLKYPDLELDITVRFGEFEFTPTCAQMVDFLLTEVESDSDFCVTATFYAFVCGCNDGIRTYLGTTTKKQQAVLAWLPRGVGLISLVGSAMILRDVLRRRPDKRRLNHRLVSGMSLFDIVSSVAIMFSTLPIPEYQYGLPTGVYGAKGNQATCRAQGFFVQLGYTATFFNLALSINYLLTIKYGYRESMLQKYKYYFYLPPLLVGFALAFAGIAFYDNTYVLCHVPPPIFLEVAEGDYSFISVADTWWPIVMLSVVPLGLVIAAGCTSMALIYLHVRKQDRAANKWRADQNNALSNAVSWQAFFYMSAFLLCWPIYFYANLCTRERWDDYAFWVTVLILFPLQGFFNSLVYFRSHFFQSARTFRSTIRAKREQRKSEAVARASGNRFSGDSSCIPDPDSFNTPVPDSSS